MPMRALTTSRGLTSSARRRPRQPDGDGQACADEARTAPVAGAAGARAAVRLADEYFLRTVRLIGDLFDGELLTAIVFRAVVAGNIGYLDANPAEAAAYGDIETPPPDHLRRPVSVLSLSGSLSLPYETTRRHVQKLIAAGQCQAVKGGVIAPASALVGPREAQAMLDNLANLRRLYRGLKKAGISLD